MSKNANSLLLLYDDALHGNLYPNAMHRNCLRIKWNEKIKWNRTKDIYSLW